MRADVQIVVSIMTIVKDTRAGGDFQESHDKGEIGPVVNASRRFQVSGFGCQSGGRSDKEN